MCICAPPHSLSLSLPILLRPPSLFSLSSSPCSPLLMKELSAGICSSYPTENWSQLAFNCSLITSPCSGFASKACFGFLDRVMIYIITSGLGTSVPGAPSQGPWQWLVPGTFQQPSLLLPLQAVCSASAPLFCFLALVPEASSVLHCAFCPPQPALTQQTTLSEAPLPFPRAAQHLLD